MSLGFSKCLIQFQLVILHFLHQDWVKLLFLAADHIMIQENNYWNPQVLLLNTGKVLCDILVSNVRFVTGLVVVLWGMCVCTGAGPGTPAGVIVAEGRDCFCRREAPSSHSCCGGSALLPFLMGCTALSDSYLATTMSPQADGKK